MLSTVQEILNHFENLLSSEFLTNGRVDWNNVLRHEQNTLDEVNSASDFIRFGSVNVEIPMDA
jgi:hypothetical protein